MGKIFISGGGTGGHFFPALALLEYVLELNSDVVFVGSKRGIEYKLEDQIRSEKIFLPAYPFVGKSVLYKVKAIASLFNNCFYLYPKVKKGTSIVFGGYASISLGCASILKRTPFFIHEQNSIPSLTNTLLSRFAKKIFVTFEYSKKYFPKEKTIKTGLPVRKKLLDGLSLNKKEIKKAFGLKDDIVLLVMGGSQGASFLNELGMQLFKKMELQGIHITGEKDYQKVKNFYEQNKLNVIVFPFSRDMELIYKASDVAISRAGAASITELSLYGIPSLFIPYPYSARDHQYYNALEIQEMGGALLLRQKDTNVEEVVKFLEKLMSDLNSYSKNIKKFANPESAKIIMSEILKEE